MPLYGGSNIFGTAVHMKTLPDENARQTNEYFGLQGLEELDGGRRGAKTVATGLFIGATGSDLGSFFQTLWSYQDGIERTLVDQYGIAWPSVKLSTAKPTSDIKFDPGKGYCQTYEIIFTHLI